MQPIFFTAIMPIQGFPLSHGLGFFSRRKCRYRGFHLWPRFAASEYATVVTASIGLRCKTRLGWSVVASPGFACAVANCFFLRFLQEFCLPFQLETAPLPRGFNANRTPFEGESLYNCSVKHAWDFIVIRYCV